MIPTLDEIESRVLGVLIEKSLTTPEAYPLSLNGLVLGCNQKTSRDPVMTLEESAVGAALHGLIARGLAGRIHEPGARVAKFIHHADHLLGSEDVKTTAALCVLLLRGPQTPGEIKTRTDRLCEFAGTAEVEALMQEVALRPEPWVVKLPRQPGQKEARYRQLFTAETAQSAGAAAAAPSAPPAPDRVAELEKRVAALEEAVRRLTPPAQVPG